jgi:hypothetical protein
MWTVKTEKERELQISRANMHVNAHLNLYTKKDCNIIVYSVIPISISTHISMSDMNNSTLRAHAFTSLYKETYLISTPKRLHRLLGDTKNVFG